MDNFLTETFLLGLNLFEFFILTVASFIILYFIFTSLAFVIFKSDNYVKFQTKAYRPQQIITEVKRSVVTILMFGVLSVPVFYGLQSGFFKIIFEFSILTFLTEVSILFLWNEIHFYAVHRIFHTKWFYKFHASHHFSHVPSPFSAYSFHWSEGLLLGAVLPLIMCFHNFQLFSILVLPILSIVFNVLGHSNIDFFPKKSINSIFSFSKRHSMHHKAPQTNFGFFLPHVDRFMKTNGPDYDT